MTDRTLPFVRRERKRAIAQAGGPLIARASIGPARPDQMPSGLTQTQLEAILCRELGEQAERDGDPQAALAHYTRAVDLWWQVGCRRRRDLLARNRS